MSLFWAISKWRLFTERWTKIWKTIWHSFWWVKGANRKDPTLTTRNVAHTFGCSHTRVQYHFKELRLVSKLGEWIPHDLTQMQLKKRVDICQQLLYSRRTYNWLDNLITGDEKWVLYTNTTRKRQWLKPGQVAKPTPKVGLHPPKKVALYLVEHKRRRLLRVATREKHHNGDQILSTTM